MSETVYPSNTEELRETLRAAVAAGRTIELFGANTKQLMAGPVLPADVRLSTAKMTRILKYEPRDLTVSVEAGIPYARLSEELAKFGQMIPLAGPYSSDATVGGIVAANVSESRRRAYGTARDLVIGMEFATLEGKLVRSGGMVVKNVAGLDMGKLMIGSFGTLAAIATVNFKLLPIPTVSRTLIFEFADYRHATGACENILQAGLSVQAIDLLNPALAGLLGRKGFILAVQFGGNNPVIERSVRTARGLWGEFGNIFTLAEEDERTFWRDLAAVTAGYLDKRQEGAVARISTPISETCEALVSLTGPGQAMAASGIVRGWFDNAHGAAGWLEASLKRGWKGVVEFCGPQVDRRNAVLWPAPGGDFEIMKKIKALFDPGNLLNRNRLHGRI